MKENVPGHISFDELARYCHSHVSALDHGIEHEAARSDTPKPNPSVFEMKGRRDAWNELLSHIEQWKRLDALISTESVDDSSPRSKS